MAAQAPTATFPGAPRLVRRGLRRVAPAEPRAARCPQYAAFYFRLASEQIRQRRSYTSLFALFESWGAIGAFLYFIFGISARQWNTYFFHRQVRGLDIRKLDKGQFTPLGRLIDKSFQMPREFQCMQAD